MLMTLPNLPPMIVGYKFLLPWYSQQVNTFMVDRRL